MTFTPADTTRATIKRFCKEAIEYNFASVCFNPTHVKYAASLLKGTSVKVCAVIGFPLGATTSFVKAFEVRDAIANGVQEVDMVINIGAVKDGNFKLVKHDIKASTGVRTTESVLQMINAGASRIGTGSGIAIVTGGKPA